MADLVAKYLRRGDDRHPKELQGARALPDRVGAGDMQHAQGFDRAVLAFRDAGTSAMQCSAGGIDRVQIVVLALATAVRSVGAGDLKDHDAGVGEVSSEAGAVGPGALDADPGWVTELSNPCQRRPVAGACCREAPSTQQCFAGVDDGGDVELFVRGRRRRRVSVPGSGRWLREFWSCRFPPVHLVCKGGTAPRIDRPADKTVISTLGAGSP